MEETEDAWWCSREAGVHAIGLPGSVNQSSRSLTDRPGSFAEGRRLRPQEHTLHSLDEHFPKAPASRGTPPWCRQPRGGRAGRFGGKNSLAAGGRGRGALVPREVVTN